MRAPFEKNESLESSEPASTNEPKKQRAPKLESESPYKRVPRNKNES